MFVPFFDINYLIFSLPAIILGLIAQFMLTVYTSKYQKIGNRAGLTGAQLVEKIAEKRNYDISLATTQAKLGDHYNPINRTLTLSREIASLPSITSVGIAAHELGHVEQHFKGLAIMKLRTAIVPVVNIGSQLGYILLIIGIIIGFTSLAWLGIVLFSFATLFSFLTLPIEFDASRRALKMLREEQILLPQEIKGAKTVLSAAALTYVAGTLQAVGSLLYFVLRVQGISRD